ncbi:transposable element Tcb2 transposase [Trichonephila clavipes]|nr:transposable element Tcb2 transposase [Trichonephila clavipes]
MIDEDDSIGVNSLLVVESMALDIGIGGRGSKIPDAVEEDEVEKLAYQLNEEAEWTERPIRRLSKVMYGSTCADMQVDVMGECLSSIKHGAGEQLSGVSVVVIHEEPHPQMTGTLSYRPEETSGRQRDKSLDTRHRRLDDRYRVLPWPEDCTVVVCLHDALYDESRFSLSSDSHRIFIWRERGSRSHPSNIIERDRYGGRGVLVWRGIMHGSRTDLHIFDAGSVNGTRYCNEILLPYVRLFRGAMGLQFLFMDDNAPCHRTVAAEQLLECEDIERMDWPARSPDLNPIEHVWDFLGRRLAARTLPPVTIRELRLALQDEWAAMPQQLIDTLILSMGRRCETCLAVNGRSYPLLKTGCFLLDIHHRDVLAFSRIALHATFSIKLLFIPPISLLVSVAYIAHVLTYWGSYGIKCVDLECFCTKLY